MPAHDAPHNPFEGVTDYFSELYRMRRAGVHGSDQGHEERQRTHASAWVPTTDIFVRGDDLVIAVELAGVSPDDVHLSLSHSLLTISGRREPDDVDGESSYYVRERFSGEFRRTVTLPDGVEPSQVTAVFDDGLVEITVAGGVAREANRIELTSRDKGATTRSLGGS